MHYLYVLPLLLVLCGCGGGGGGTQDPNAGSGRVEVRITIPSGIRSVSEIASFRLSVTGAGMDPIVRVPSYNPATHTGSDSFYVLAGATRAFAVEALNSAGTVIYSGSSTADIIAGQVTYIEISLAPSPSGVNISITIDNQPLGVVFDHIPAIGANEALTGHITGIDPGRVALAVYIKVGGVWWSKPTAASPLTIPNNQGQWSCQIVTGGNDAQATEIAAFLLLRGTVPPLVLGGDLPTIPEAIADTSVVR
ncbi:MAG: hypothetical protein AAB881_01895 [Patescibacteria group bacterium]